MSRFSKSNKLSFEEKRSLSHFKRKKSRIAKRLSKLDKLGKKLSKYHQRNVVGRARILLLNSVTAYRYDILEEGANKLSVSLEEFAKLIIDSAYQQDRERLYAYLKQFLG